jgi:hypothetical protein
MRRPLDGDELSCEAVVAACLERIGQVNPALNAAVQLGGTVAGYDVTGGEVAVGVLAAVAMMAVNIAGVVVAARVQAIALLLPSVFPAWVTTHSGPLRPRLACGNRPRRMGCT